MTADSKGRDLFIVDNSVSGWTGLRYLEEWSGIAKAFDIATGYFEIGADTFYTSGGPYWSAKPRCQHIADIGSSPATEPVAETLDTPLPKRTNR